MIFIYVYLGKINISIDKIYIKIIDEIINKIIYEIFIIDLYILNGGINYNIIKFNFFGKICEIMSEKIFDNYYC